MKKLTINPIMAKYLLFTGLFYFGMSFSSTTYAPFLVSKGLDLFKVNLINSCFMIVNFIAEMPTGSYADRFGRHKSLIVSCLLLAIGGLVYYFSSSLTMFLIAESVGAIGQTFASGAADAWMVDSLKARNQFDFKKVVLRKKQSAKTAGIIFGAITGSILGGINLELAWLGLAIVMTITALFVTFFIKENYVPTMNKNNEKSGLFEQINTAWNIGIKNNELLYMMSFGAILALAIQALNMQWTILFKDDHNFSSSQLGIFFAVVSIAVAAGSWSTKFFYKIIKNEVLAIIIPQLITALAIIICSRLTNSHLVISTFLLHEFSRGMYNPLHENYTNDRFPSEVRATLSSLDSMFNKGGAFVGLIVSGLLATSYSIRLTWLCSGLFLAIGIIIFIIKHQRQVNN